VTIRAADLREGDRIALVTLTVGSVMELNGSIYVHFVDNDRVEVLNPDAEVEVTR
jgi:sulfur carrier protein ThiS